MKKIKDNKNSFAKKYLKIRALIILVVLLAFNSYAWFVFATKVSGGISAHVTSWNVDFQADDNDSITNIEIDVSTIYPGMETYVKEIKVKNSGETIADLSYNYKSLRVLDEEYIIGENCTEEELNEKIQNEYPFKISVTVNKYQLETGNDEGLFTITIEWPYESGDDQKDTYWGEKAYEFNKNNENESSLHLSLELIAIQKDKETI